MKNFLLLKSLIIAALISPTLASAEDGPAANKPPRAGNAAPGAPADPSDAREFQTFMANSQAQRRIASRDNPPPLIIDYSSAGDRRLAALTEDLNIMAHLLEKSLERFGANDAPDVKMGVPIIVNAAAPSVRAMYLDGFGALFLVKVNFPLMGPRRLEEKKPDLPPGSEWEDVKRELSVTEPGNGWDAIESYVIGGDYDEERIEALQSGLMESLKNASNIRNLRPDESIGVTVFGTPAPIQVPARTAKGKTGRSAKNDAAALRELSRSAAGRQLAARARQGTVMTIRVKKSEVDSFARARLNLNEFQRRSTVTFYLGSGYATQSPNTWSQIGANYGRFTP